MMDTVELNSVAVRFLSAKGSDDNQARLVTKIATLGKEQQQQLCFASNEIMGLDPKLTCLNSERQPLIWGPVPNCVDERPCNHPC